jgi:hypothetical protein
LSKRREKLERVRAKLESLERLIKSNFSKTAKFGVKKVCGRRRVASRNVKRGDFLLAVREMKTIFERL